VGHPVWPHSGLDSTTFLVGFRVEKVEAKRIKGARGAQRYVRPLGPSNMYRALDTRHADVSARKARFQVE
jgi:hypothetical protein